jgi:tetratricopeptide (TPR) repeat protein
LNARFVVALLVLLLGAGAVAQAAPVDKRELEARADYAAGRYQKAVDGFAALFADTADPVYLRNIGRCYQKMKQPQQAIDSFQEYLQKARNLSRTERHEIEGYIKEMEVLKIAQAAETPATPPAVVSPLVAPPLPPTPPTPPSVTPPVTVLQPAPPPAGEAGTARSWRIAGIATAAGGAAFIAVGIAYGLAARRAADAVSQQYSATTESDGKRDVSLQWIGYGVGGAALVTGALLYWHGVTAAAPSSSERTASLRGGATFDRNGGALLLEGSF